MDKKRVLICGAGSVGVYIGVKLSSNGHHVDLFGRRKLKETEEEITINDEKFKVPKRLFNLPKNQKYDFVFLTTKLYDLEQMVNQIKKSHIRYIHVVGIQNGLVDTSKYSKQLNKIIVPIVVFSGFNLKKDRIIVNPTSVGWKTEYSKEGKEISRFLHETGIPCAPDKKFDSLRAEKAIVNSCLNALSAIEKKPFKKLFEVKKTRERIDKLFWESYKILEKEYKLDKLESMRRKMFEHWSNLNHFSSTYQDVVSGRKNEACFFNGYLVNIGEKNGCQVEENKKIMEEINKIK